MLGAACGIGMGHSMYCTPLSCWHADASRGAWCTAMPTRPAECPCPSAVARRGRPSARHTRLCRARAAARLTTARRLGPATSRAMWGTWPRGRPLPRTRAGWTATGLEARRPQAAQVLIVLLLSPSGGLLLGELMPVFWAAHTTLISVPAVSCGTISLTAFAPRQVPPPIATRAVD